MKYRYSLRTIREFFNLNRRHFTSIKVVFSYFLSLSFTRIFCMLSFSLLPLALSILLFSFLFPIFLVATRRSSSHLCVFHFWLCLQTTQTDHLQNCPMNSIYALNRPENSMGWSWFINGISTFNHFMAKHFPM